MLCQQHSSPAARLCLSSNCSSRALCLLCEHSHEDSVFSSLKNRETENYAPFVRLVSRAIDEYLSENEEVIISKLHKKQHTEIQTYFSTLKGKLEQFLAAKEEEIMEKFFSNQDELLRNIKKDRFGQSYYRTDNIEMFPIYLRLYEGESLRGIVERYEEQKMEEIQNKLNGLNEQLEQVLNKNDFKMKLVPPKIRNYDLLALKKEKAEQTYEFSEVSRHLSERILKENMFAIEALISDLAPFEENYLLSSYDKTIRLIDKDINLLQEYEYENIITKVHQIMPSTVAVAVSKELRVERLLK